MYDEDKYKFQTSFDWMLHSKPFSTSLATLMLLLCIGGFPRLLLQSKPEKIMLLEYETVHYSKAIILPQPSSHNKKHLILSATSLWDMTASCPTFLSTSLVSFSHLRLLLWFVRPENPEQTFWVGGGRDSRIPINFCLSSPSG